MTKTIRSLGVVMADQNLEPDSPEAIGARIKHIRQVFGLTLKGTGEICGTSHSTVGNWEQARQKPTISQGRLLADHLGLTLDYIFLGRLGSVPLDTARRLSADDRPKG